MDRVNELFTKMKDKGKGPTDRILALSSDDFQLLMDLDFQNYGDFKEISFSEWECYKWGEVVLFVITQLKKGEWIWYQNWYHENK